MRHELNAGNGSLALLFANTRRSAPPDKPAAAIGRQSKRNIRCPTRPKYVPISAWPISIHPRTTPNQFP